MSDRLLALLAAVLLLSSVASAEDKLKPLIDTFFNAIKSLADLITEAVFGLFPGLRQSLSADILAPIAVHFPWIRGFYWLFYLAVFFVVMAVIAKIWSMGQHFIVNTVVGLIILLILVHLLGVELKITVLVLVITAIFGVPGVIFVVLMHYVGIPL